MPGTTNARPLLASLVVGLMLFAAALAWQAGVRAQPAVTLEARSSSLGGVTVVVTPRAARPGAKELEFRIVLDTHSQDLSDDLASATILLLDGVELKPTQWSGPVPGGHHREGILRFAVPDKPAGAIELRIQRPNEPTPRVFRWDGAALR